VVRLVSNINGIHCITNPSFLALSRLQPSAIADQVSRRHIHCVVRAADVQSRKGQLANLQALLINPDQIKALITQVDQDLRELRQDEKTSYQTYTRAKADSDAKMGLWQTADKQFRAVLSDTKADPAAVGDSLQRADEASAASKTSNDTMNQAWEEYQSL
jgi:hypothetical protein